MKPFYVYLLRCADDSYYCGQTDNLEIRLQQHETGNIGYTATRKPVTLKWQGEFEKREDALAFEQQIKGWSRAKKEALIADEWNKVRELAKSRQPMNLTALDSMIGCNDAAKNLVCVEPALRQAQGERWEKQ